jgi:hypothetical protein
VLDMVKTTVYIDETDLELLRTKAFVVNCSVADLVRKSIKVFCANLEDSKKLVKQLNTLRKKNDKYSFEEIMSSVNEARAEARAEKRKKNR